MEFQLTKNQQEIFDLIESSNENFLIQGKPGTGKSVLTRALVSDGRKHYVVAAPTGLAALNANGKTLHSLLRLPVSDGIVAPDYKRYNLDDRTLNNIKYHVKHLIIDEISMVRCDMFDYIDRLLRVAKEKDVPFGGVQMILIGDFYQIPPVCKALDKKQLREAGYESPFVFSSRIFSNNFKVLSLHEVLRQKGDPVFIDLLDSARNGYMSAKEIGLLNKQVKSAEDATTIRLCGTNAQADEINTKFLNAIQEQPQQFTAQKMGEWPALPVDENLTLKVGAQIIVKVNGADIPPNQKSKSNIVNGTLGKVVAIGKEDVDIELLNGKVAKIYIKRWERKIKTQRNGEWEEVVIATYSQMPLQLAWAISIHKSQGQSFERCHIDANKIFAAGQLYVALSRCRTLKGLTLEQKVNERKFWADPAVVEFFESIEV
jgi:ATP-dependent exoDNAse (exonuclease V) alpha subunit